MKSNFNSLAHAPPHAPAARGCVEKFPATENLHTNTHPSYPSFFSRSGSLYSTTTRSNSHENWPEFQIENRPKPRFSNSVPKLKIDPNLPHNQLEHTAEAAAQRSETSGSNQSIPSTILRLSGKEIGWVLIGTSRRVQRDWSRGLRWTVAAAARWFPFGLHSDGRELSHAEGGDAGERERESEG
ncbi:unnamed protein product [Prunus armeniaca]